MLNNNVTPLAYSAKRGYKQKQLFHNIKEWMNTRSAAEYLDISSNALRVKISRGLIHPDGHLGSSPRFRLESLDNLLASRFKGGKR